MTSSQTTSFSDISLLKKVELPEVYNVFEGNVNALVIVDLLGIITDANQQMEVLVGIPRSELVGHAFKDFFAVPELAEKGLELAIKEEKVPQYELMARAKDGHPAYLSYSFSLFKNREGKLLGIVASAIDITEQKKIAGQLQQAQAYYHGLFESSQDGFATLSPEGKIVDVNKRLSEMSGYSREELIDDAFVNYLLEKPKFIEEVLTKGSIKPEVFTLITSDNKHVKVSCSVFVVYNLSKKIEGLFVAVHDITDLMQLQAKLEEERIYNRGLIESSLEGLLVVDSFLVITDCNAQICNMLGCTKEELLNSLFPDHFADPKAAAEGIRRALDEDKKIERQLNLIQKSGEQIVVSVHANAFQESIGQKKRVVISVLDATEKVKLQAQISDEQAYYRGLMEVSADGLVIINENMEITDLNETMCRMIGHPRGHLVGTLFRQHFLDSNKAEEIIKSTLKTGAISNVSFELKTAYKESLPISLNVFRFSSGEETRLFICVRDNSEQKQLKEKINAAEFYTQARYDSLVDAMIATDLTGTINDLNHQTEELLGYGKQELIGTSIKNCFLSPEKVDEVIGLTLQEGKVANFVIPMKTKSGKTVEASYNAMIFNNREGRPQGIFIAMRDLREQKKLESKLRDQQLYLRGLIESAVDGLITVSPDGAITDVNEKMCQMTGYSREELIGSLFHIYFTDPEKAREGLKQTLTQGAVTNYDLTLIARSKKMSQVSINASIFKDSEGNVKGIFASARDVTEKTRLEEQLREQKAYLRGLIESSVDGLLMIDTEGYITDVNAHMCKMVKIDRSTLIGSRFKTFFTDAEKAEMAVKSVFAQGMIQNYELVLKSQTGLKSTISLNASVYRSAGNITGIFASIRDVSEQALLHRQLIEQQTYNRSLIEASPDALFAIAEDGTILDVNEETIRITGYTRKHLLNSSFPAYFLDPQAATQGIQRTFAEKRVLNYELTLLTLGGRRVNVSFNASVFTDIGGAALGILAIARDITVQKELETQLRDEVVRQNWTQKRVKISKICS